ncbi:MAG: hypothetical protein ONB17_03750 [candidate division KSB1 bacterium]|nr:hypothetical protein [candidate division KSB1 bacterium]MDZ7294865.1 hypothetical protein [candidate division KSB1 bacterium]MDZ7377972.1 hypothetical protein [candidate division KSB1 bacterium]MDZ7393272.1 hypothetical protein [candidate division KSB1 bacterium]MDZ7412358.1 hypothetical protein [candidate division KSB1 bacterium]
MKGHPTDWQLQQWIEDGAPQTGEVGEHVRRCEECAREARSYVQLWQTLARPPEVVLRAHFAQRVAARVRAQRRRDWLVQVATIGGIASYAAAGIGVLIYFGVFALLRRAFSPLWLGVLRVVDSLERLALPSFPALSPLFLASVGFLLLCIAVFDHFLAQRLRPR